MQPSSDDQPDLLTWLREQIYEDERIAQAARHGVSGRWDHREDRADCGAVEYGTGVDDWPEWSSNGVVVYDEDAPTFDQAVHIARHDPAHVLREVEAKRRIIEVVESWRHLVVEDCWYTCPAATEQREGEVSCNDNWEPGQGPCNCGVDQRRRAILGPLALTYADRPGYREEWRP